MRFIRHSGEDTARAQVKGAIVRMILSRGYKVADKLPSYGEMAAQFDVSARTIVRAVHELADEGTVQMLQGKGVYLKKMPRGCGKLTTIGLAYPASQLELLRQGYLTQILTGAIGACGESDIDLQIMAFRPFHHSKPFSSRPTPPRNLALRVDGLMLLGVVNESYIVECAQEAMPLVLVDAQTQATPISCIAVDNARAVDQVMDHLYELGHRRIAYGDVRSQDDFNWGSESAWLDTADTRERREAYLAARQRLGLDYERVYAATEASALEGAPALVTAIRQDPKPPSAIVCYDEWWAVCLHRLLADRGVHVPRDISIAGAAGTTSGHFAGRQAITCSVVDFEEMGNRAIVALQRQTGKDSQTWPQVERIGSTLEIGTTTARPGQ